MKKISPLDDEIYFCILKSFLDFIAYWCAFWLKKKDYEYQFLDNPKGVGQLKRLQRKEFTCLVDCFNKKISEKFCIELKYIERSRKLFITVYSSADNFLPECLRKIKNKKLLSGLLASYFNILAQGLLEAYLPCLPFEFNFCGNYFYKQIKRAKLNRLKIFNKPIITAYVDNILTILCEIYSQRKVQISFVKVKIDDILELRGIKKHGNKFQKQDIKRVFDALEFLSFCGFLYFKKLTKREISFYIPHNSLVNGYFIDETLVLLNPKTQRFEYVLGLYLLNFAQKGIFYVNLKKIVELVLKYTKIKKPSEIRDRIENAFDNLQSVQMLKNWEYKEINEDDFIKRNWLEEYKKLKIIFVFKKHFPL